MLPLEFTLNILSNQNWLIQKFGMASRTAFERSRCTLKAISYHYINFSVRAMARKMIDFTGLSSSQLKAFKNRYDAYIFDMDGNLSILI